MLSAKELRTVDANGFWCWHLGRIPDAVELVDLFLTFLDWSVSCQLQRQFQSSLLRDERTWRCPGPFAGMGTIVQHTSQKKTIPQSRLSCNIDPGITFDMSSGQYHQSVLDT